MIPAADLAGQTVPRHIAVIMDGNGRWAKSKRLPRFIGHQRGADAVKEVVDAATAFGVGYLTLYAFSSENWKRPRAEVDDLMSLLRRFLRRDLAELHAKGVRLRVIGDRVRLDADIVALIENAEAQTAANEVITVTLAISYGGQDDILAAARALARDVKQGLLEPEAINGDVFATRLATSGLPDPDLVIRTSGEKRLSNFLLWQTAYAEFVFVDTLWPDFGRDDLRAAITEFRARDRRFGERKD